MDGWVGKDEGIRTQLNTFVMMLLLLAVIVDYSKAAYQPVLYTEITEITHHLTFAILAQDGVWCCTVLLYKQLQQQHNIDNHNNKNPTHPHP